MRPYRDRGEGLFFGRPRRDGCVPEGWEAAEGEKGCVLIPCREKIEAFGEAYLKRSPDARKWGLTEELLRLKDRPAGREEMLLCCAGMKKLEEDPRTEEISAYETALRKQAALCLRAGGGGLLWVAALCLAEMKRKKEGHTV